MARHFPIFIDLGGSPPLVIGTDPGLAAKIRLLAGFAPAIDLVTGQDTPPAELGLAGARHLGGRPVDDAASLFAGRPLVVISTGDSALDENLSRRARAMGVPVNVPDRPALCSFYLGAIVDRDPVILAISTGGFAPVLAQRLRAGIEDWLPAGYGRIAHYLHRIRNRLRTLPAARRRRLQHRIIDGDAARCVIDGDEVHADALLVDMLSERVTDTGGTLHVVRDGAGDPPGLDRRAIEAIRNADVILHAPGGVPAPVRLARREVELVAAPPETALARAAALRSRGLEVVIILASGPTARPTPQAAQVTA
ncbi:MAG: precorrin-2 dehydrogenase/sirohydrochlorin ferrochelatase family protein [Candidatus Puniceispirillaceae bacterium]